MPWLHSLKFTYNFKKTLVHVQMYWIHFSQCRMHGTEYHDVCARHYAARVAPRVRRSAAQPAAQGGMHRETKLKGTTRAAALGLDCAQSSRTRCPLPSPNMPKAAKKTAAAAAAKPAAKGGEASSTLVAAKAKPPSQKLLSLRAKRQAQHARDAAEKGDAPEDSPLKPVPRPPSLPPSSCRRPQVATPPNRDPFFVFLCAAQLLLLSPPFLLMLIPSVLDKPMLMSFLCGLAGLLAVLALRGPASAKKKMTAAPGKGVGAARLKAAGEAEVASLELELAVETAKETLTKTKKDLEEVKDQKTKKVLTTKKTVLTNKLATLEKELKEAKAVAGAAAVMAKKEEEEAEESSDEDEDEDDDDDDDDDDDSSEDEEKEEEEEEDEKEEDEKEEKKKVAAKPAPKGGGSKGKKKK